MKVANSLLSSAILMALFGLSAQAANEPSTGNMTIELNILGHYQPDGEVFDKSAAEIVAHDRQNQRLFVVNAADVTVDVMDMRDPTALALLNSIDATAEGGSANSVAVYEGLVAVAIEATTTTDNGKVVFYNASDLSKVGEMPVGALPDMLTFTHDGQKLLVANEGEPNDSYTVDPEGSVSIIDLSQGVAAATVTTAGFSAFNGQEEALRVKGVRIFGPGATAAQDFEPEYIAVASDNATAWVALQENNAVATLDIDSGEITDVIPLGFKNHSLPGNELDVSNRDLNATDKDGAINIRNWPVFGMYMPDSTAGFEIDGVNYYITANEGDARDYDGFGEEFRVKDLALAEGAFPDDIQSDHNLGRLKVSGVMGVSNGCDPSDVSTDIEADCEFDALYAYGGRSFSIWTADGEQVFDSGSDLERITAERIPNYFNANNDENSFDNRSDDKGPEPEAVVTGVVDGQTYAFIGLERVGGIVVYDVSNPQAPTLVQYINNRDFSVSQADLEAGKAGDLGPEGLAFITAEDSPNGKPILVVGNEVSGSTTVYGIETVKASGE